MNQFPPTGPILREKQPENLEFPFCTLDSFITPNERFFIRSHFPVPALDRETWRLQVEGAVERPFELSYADLLEMPARTVVALLECAGNGRVYLTPKARGVQWELGAVGAAAWTGVPLSAVLERAGLQDAAVDVVLEGADSGEVTEEPKSPGTISYARSLPLEKALQPDVLLAYRMNGEDLSASHGFPMRAIVPGWYGMASVKWLVRIVVTDRPFQGFYQTADYAYWERRDGLPAQRLPIQQMLVKAQIARPVCHEIVPAGASYRVHGAAWSGEAEVIRVEVSTDGGVSWSEAQLQDESSPHAWRLWEYVWQAPSQPGTYTLMARATDSQGRVQPMERDCHCATYMVSHVLPVTVEVR